MPGDGHALPTNLVAGWGFPPRPLTSSTSQLRPCDTVQEAMGHGGRASESLSNPFREDLDEASERDNDDVEYAAVTVVEIDMEDLEDDDGDEDAAYDEEEDDWEVEVDGECKIIGLRRVHLGSGVTIFVAVQICSGHEQPGADDPQMTHPTPHSP